jgi:hypothetical protein
MNKQQPAIFSGLARIGLSLELVRNFVTTYGTTVARRTFLLRTLAALFVFGVLIERHVGAWAGSSDSSGYMNDARLLDAREFHPMQRTIAGIPPEKLPFMGYIPLGFLPMNNGRMYPTYPMGLPVAIFLGSTVFGWGAGPNVVMWMHAMACIVAMYFLCRELKLGREISFLGTLFFGSSSLFLFSSLHAMSDTPAALWAILAALGCLKSERKAGWAIFAGFCFAYGILVRPTNLLMIVPILFLFRWNLRRAILFCIGAAPVAACLVIMNHMLYGKSLTTGYGDFSSLFGLRYVSASLHNYLSWIPVEMTPLIVLALGFPFVVVDMRRGVRVGVIVWFATFATFYATYYYTHETWWFLRFLLPAIPALIVGMLSVIAAVGKQYPSLKFVGGLLLTCFLLRWNVVWTHKLYALDSGAQEKEYPDTCVFIKNNVPRDAVILCMQASGSVLFYTDHTIVRWDCIGETDFLEIVKACDKTGQQIYMVLFSFEEKSALKKFSGARWTDSGKVSEVSIWHLARGY